MSTCPDLLRDLVPGRLSHLNLPGDLHPDPVTPSSQVATVVGRISFRKTHFKGSLPMEIEGRILVERLCPVSGITPESYENSIVFLEKLKEALQKFTNLELDTFEGQVILKDKVLSQSASGIRIKLQQLQQQDPAASLDEMIQTATNTFCNREQERKAKAQEREKRKRQGMHSCWPPSREALWQTPSP